MNIIDKDFVAIDFETATQQRNTACAVGIVTFENGKITEEYYSLIQPPNNEYHKRCIQVHGITEIDTENALPFDKIYPEIKKRLQGKTIVAHKEHFDRGVLRQSMELYGINAPELKLNEKWECSLKIYKAKGFKPAGLADCCKIMDIELVHHQALSDARACGLLYLKQ